MQFKEGDRVSIITREVTEKDQKDRRYFPFMGGLTGTVQNVYAESQVAVRVDESSLSKISLQAHTEATRRMREKLASSISEEQKKELTKEELEFNTHFMLLIHSDDLQQA
jgi:ribosomal protein L21E